TLRLVLATRRWLFRALHDLAGKFGIFGRPSRESFPSVRHLGVDIGPRQLHAEIGWYGPCRIVLPADAGGNEIAGTSAVVRVLPIPMHQRVIAIIRQVLSGDGVDIAEVPERKWWPSRPYRLVLVDANQLPQPELVARLQAQR